MMNMMNNTVAANNVSVEVIAKMTKAEINELFDLKLSEKDLRKIKKDELVERAAKKVVNIPVVAATEIKEVKKDMGFNVREAAKIAIIAIMVQSWYSVLGDGLVLFYVPKKPEYKGNKISSNSRLRRVIGDVVSRKFGKSQDTNENYNAVLEDLASCGYIHLVTIKEKNGGTTQCAHMNTNEWKKATNYVSHPLLREAVIAYSNFAKEQAEKYNAKKPARKDQKPVQQAKAVTVAPATEAAPF